MGGKLSSQHNFTYEGWERRELHYPSKWEEAMVNADMASALGTDEKQRWIRAIKERIKVMVPPRSSSANPSTFFRVPEHVRQNISAGHLFDKMYRPLVVPIGPYHQHLSKNKRFALIQAHKWHCVRALLSRHGNLAHANKQLDLCLQWLLKVDVQKAVQECYPKELEMSPGELASILLVDACFIIHQLVEMQGPSIGLLRSFWKKMIEGLDLEETSYGEQENGDNEIEQESVVLDINDDDDDMVEALSGSLVVLDLVKLENQIPFFVIQYMYDKLKTTYDERELSDLAVLYFETYLRPKASRSSKNMKFQKPTKIYHLLHLYYASLVPQEIAYKVRQEKAPNSKLGDDFPKKRKKEKAPRRIPTASELRKVGIKIKRKWDASAFFDFRYMKGKIYRTLEIPKIEIHSYTESLFLNLIAFEQCLSNIEPKDAYITLYTVFMDCIISKANDVGILVSEGILISRLGSQHAVADLFNRLGKIINCKISGSYLEYLFAEVNADFKSGLRDCYSTFKRTYFPSRWAVCSILAAILLLVLTTLQVVYAMLPYYYGH